jgi:hypothetical protein
MDVRELAWAAGLFEGEGCISLTSLSGTQLRYPALTLAMTDRDSVERFRAAVGVGTVYMRPVNRSATFAHKLPLYVWKANSFEGNQAVIALLWYGLNERRRARAREVLLESKASQSLRTNRRRGEECDAEECDRPVIAKGLCTMHYQRDRKAS